MRFRSWWFIAAGWLLYVSVLAFWTTSNGNAQLRDQLLRWQFWFLETQFGLLLLLSVVNFMPLVRSLRVTKRDWAAMAVIAAMMALLAGAVAPRTNRIFYDEQIYQGIGQNLSNLRLAQMCNDGTAEYGELHCWRGEYNKQPYGYPYLLSVLYGLAGVSYWGAAHFNVAVAALLVPVVYLLALALFEDRFAAMAAALLTTLMPEQLLWSHTAASEPAAALVAAVAVLATVHFCRDRTWRALGWVVAASAFAVQFRTESVLVIPVVAIVLVVFASSELRRQRVWIGGLLGGILCAALIVHLFAVRNEPWGASGDKLALHYVMSNLRTNGLFYLVDFRFPALYTGFALVGLTLGTRKRSAVACLGYFVAFWGVYLFFYAGSYNYGADSRYSLMTFPPLALVAGVGMTEVSRRLSRFGVPPRQAFIGVAALVGFQFLLYLPLVRGTGEEAWAARADVRFAQEVVAELPTNSLVLTHNPSVFHVMGMSAAQLGLIDSDFGYVKDVLASRYAGGVYLHWNFWCNVADPLQRRFCRAALDRVPSTLLREYRERDYRYAFYRLDFTSAPSAQNPDSGP